LTESYNSVIILFTQVQWAKTFTGGTFLMPSWTFLLLGEGPCSFSCLLSLRMKAEPYKHIAATDEGKGGMLMLEIFENANILIVSASKAVINQLGELFVKAGFSAYTCVGDVHSAKGILIETDMDLVIIDAPLPDEDAAKFAMDLAKSKSLDFSIVMLTKAGLYDQNLYQAERMGIVIYKKPLDPHLLLQTIRLLLSFKVKIKKLESKADRLEQKLQDDRLVYRAKFLLIEKLKMSEQDAHYYIEKTAMDRCVKKTKVAKELIQMYDSN